MVDAVSDLITVMHDVGQVPIRRDRRAALILPRDLLNIAFMPCSQHCQLDTTLRVIGEDERLRLDPHQTEDRYYVGCSLACRE